MQTEQVLCEKRSAEAVGIANLITEAEDSVDSDEERRAAADSASESTDSDGEIELTEAPGSMLAQPADEAEEDASDNSNDQFLHDEDPSEQSQYSVESQPEPRVSRYEGHPLGIEELELQDEYIQQSKLKAQETFLNDFRFANRWTPAESRVRAKILVAEGFRKEREHLDKQSEHLLELELLKHQPRPLRRFKAYHRFRDAGFEANCKEVLEFPELHRKIVDERKRKLSARWKKLGGQVASDMEHRDNFANVIRNLSTMRIFLEGQQSMTYCVDNLESQRRCFASQNVIQEVMNREDGYFLKDALPRAEPLPLTPRYARNPPNKVPGPQPEPIPL